MDIKRVAFETRPIKSTRPRAAAARPVTDVKPLVRPPKREQIAALVDEFLSRKVASNEVEIPALTPAAPIPPPVAETPVKTIIHELRPQSLTENGTSHAPVDFVSENDVREALANGSKIYITAKTILTPSAKDLGEEKEVFARV